MRMLASRSGRRLVEALPIERLLTETDGPFITLAGRSSRPSDMAVTVTDLARLRGLSVPSMQEVILQNLDRLLS
jgi:TatD DNase family protein